MIVESKSVNVLSTFCQRFVNTGRSSNNSLYPTHEKGRENAWKGKRLTKGDSKEVSKKS